MFFVSLLTMLAVQTASAEPVQKIYYGCEPTKEADNLIPFAVYSLTFTQDEIDKMEPEQREMFKAGKESFFVVMQPRHTEPLPFWMKEVSQTRTGLSLAFDFKYDDGKDYGVKFTYNYVQKKGRLSVNLPDGDRYNNAGDEGSYKCEMPPAEPSDTSKK